MIDFSYCNCNPSKKIAQVQQDIEFAQNRFLCGLLSYEAMVKFCERCEDVLISYEAAEEFKTRKVNN